MVIERKYLWLHFYFLLNTHSHNGWHFRYGNLMTFKTSLVSYEMEVIGSGSMRDVLRYPLETWMINWIGVEGNCFDFFFLVNTSHQTGVCVWRTWGKPGSDGLSVSCVISVENPSSMCRSHSDTRLLKPNCQEFVRLWKSYFDESFFISTLRTTSSILCLDISILLPIVVLLCSDKVLTYAQKIMII